MPRIAIRSLAVLLAAGAALGACARAGEPTPAAPEGRDAASLRASAERATLGGKALRLESYLWRDFMPGPGVGAAGKPMIAALKVITVDGSAFPAGVTADSAWIVNGAEVWGAPVRAEQPMEPGSSTLELVAREGPRWGPGISVDVVIRLRDASGATALLRVPAQPIHRTS